MKTIEITEKNMRDALKVAKSDEVKSVLSALFCGETNKPSLDDYTSIKTYEDACEALGENVKYFDRSIPKHIIALMKLETISRALWGRNFQPTPDPEGRKIYYNPWFAFYTEKEMESMDEDDRGSLLSVNAHTGANAWFGILYTYPGSWYASADIGFRLCQETYEKTLYFGQNFAEIWADYLAFNFVTGERIIK